jgi:uncharacterized small protein (DUF1192 family)
VYEQRSREYEGRISLLTQEIERLNQVLRSRLEQNEQWKSKYSQLEIQLSEIRIFEQKCKDYEGRITLLTQEIERLNSNYYEKCYFFILEYMIVFKSMIIIITICIFNQ